MFCRWFISSLLVTLVANSLAQDRVEPTTSSSNPSQDVPLKSQTSCNEHHYEPKDSCGRPHFHPVNNIQIQGCYDSRITSALDNLLHLTRTILELLRNQEPRCPLCSNPPCNPACTDSPLIDPPHKNPPRTDPPRTDQQSTDSQSTDPPRTEPLITDSRSTTTLPDNLRDCAEIQAIGVNISGVYSISPDGDGDPFFVSCDMETDGGGWTVFQRRQDGSVDFYLEWADYKHGFGNVTSEHWLGNDNIHRLAIQKTYDLRIDLEDFEGQTRYALYSNFQIGDEDANYALTVGEYSGDAGDGLRHNAGSQFSTKERDNDNGPSTCAVARTGAWWYNNCSFSNLNGRYLVGESPGTYYSSVVWSHWRGHEYSLKKAEMKIRPV